MYPAEGLKRLLYERFIHLSHLSEEYFAAEENTFAELLQEHGIAFSSTSLTSIHVLDCIGRNEPINSTAIADKMKLSKASITKISTKLLQDDCIKRSRMNDNKKEVYFSLAPKGRQLFDLHARMHEHLEQKFLESMNSFTEPELQASLKFVQTIIDHSPKHPHKVEL